MWAANRTSEVNTSAMSKSGVYPALGSHSIVSKHIHKRGVGGATTNLAYRNYVKDVDTLRKELDRKDSRNDAIAQEMKHLRQEYTTQERELRILSGAFEKCNNERVTYQNEVSRNKEYIDKLELQLSKLGNGASLVLTVDKLQLTNEHYASELSSLKGVLSFKDEKIGELQKELETFHNSVELQHQIEGDSRGATVGGDEGNDATMRTLYYELGKRQTDAHSLAISLASTNQQLKSTKEELDIRTSEEDILRRDLIATKSNAALLNQQAVRDKDEISDLLDKNQKFKSLNQRLQGMVEDLSKRLREERESFLAYKTEKDNNEQELTHTLENANKELHHLRLRMKNLEEGFKLCDKKKEHAEQLLSKEVLKMEDERKVYAAKIKEGIHTADKNKVLNMQLRDALQKKEDSSAWAPDSPVHDYASKVEGQVKAMQEELSRAREAEAELLNDREASVRALHQTIEATRELSARHADEKMKRGQAEAKLAEAEVRAKKAEGRILALMDIQQDYPKPSSSSSSGGGAEKRQGAAAKEVSFVDESDIFSPPVPPPTTSHTAPAPAPAPVRRIGPLSPAPVRRDDALRDSTASLQSNQSDTSTASSVAEELARLRAELDYIEKEGPK